LPIEYFETLARGAGSPEIVRFLWETERSRRLLLIVTLFKHSEMPGALGPLPSAAEAWSVLGEARDTDRAAVDDLLMHPQIGNAAAYALRRIRGGARSEFPAWADLGLVHTLALLAAARVGLAWSTALPARYGTVMLPTLGLARFSSAEAMSTVEARTEAGVVYLSADEEVVVGLDPADDTHNWWRLRHLTVGGKLPLTVWLDDLDPFRDLRDPVPPARLDDATCERWRHLLDDAWTLLCDHHRDTAAALAEAVVSLAPLPTGPGRETRSASNGEAFGAMLATEPPDAVTLAVTLVHEFQHIKLGALMHLLALTEDDGRSLYYAPWRDDPRPLGGLLQGIYAFFGIAGFWRQHRLTVEEPLADYEYLCSRVQTAEALRSVRDAPALTDTGRDVVLKLGSVLDTWLADRVRPDVARLARLTTDSHRVAWRLRHRRAAAGEVAVLARAWIDRRPPEIPSPASVLPAPAQRWPQPIGTLARQQVLGTSHGPLPPGDLALIRGDSTAARRAYLNRLATPSDDPDDEISAWVGLALAVSESDPGTTLVSRPDLVRAVHIDARVLSRRPVDPIEIATWLAPVVKDG
jgi:HEXXH motif-containing protein